MDNLYSIITSSKVVDVVEDGVSGGVGGSSGGVEVEEVGITGSGKTNKSGGYDMFNTLTKLSADILFIVTAGAGNPELLE